MIDLSKVRKGSRVRLTDGRVVLVVGSYMSGTGLMFTVKDNPAQAVAQNVNVEMVVELLEG